MTTKNCKMTTLEKMSKEQFAKENFPDLSKHNNIMASNLTFEVSQIDYSSRVCEIEHGVSHTKF